MASNARSRERWRAWLNSKVTSATARGADAPAGGTEAVTASGHDHLIGVGQRFVHGLSPARGDSTATAPDMGRVPIHQEFEWSRKSAEYAKLLTDFSELNRQIAAIPPAGLRYNSNLLGLLPAGGPIQKRRARWRPTSRRAPSGAGGRGGGCARRRPARRCRRGR